jgi:hypothetical protein
VEKAVQEDGDEAAVDEGATVLKRNKIFKHYY